MQKQRRTINAEKGVNLQKCRFSVADFFVFVYGVLIEFSYSLLTERQIRCKLYGIQSIRGPVCGILRGSTEQSPNLITKNTGEIRNEPRPVTDGTFGGAKLLAEAWLLFTDYLPTSGRKRVWPAPSPFPPLLLPLFPLFPPLFPLFPPLFPLFPPLLLP